MEAFIGTILPWPLNWAPVGWESCDGRLLNINQNQALFSLIGTTYGGDGRTNFALPDLRGRIPVGMGQQPGGSQFSPGNWGGAEKSILTANNMPAHSHAATLSNGSIGNGSCSVEVKLPANATNAAATDSSPDANCCLGTANANSRPVNIYSTNAPDKTLMNNSVTASGTVAGTVTGTVTVAPNGGGQSFENMQPYLVVNYIICTQGYYPQRP